MTSMIILHRGRRFAVEAVALVLALVMAGSVSFASSPPSTPAVSTPSSSSPPAWPGRAPNYDLPPQYVLDVLHAPASPRPILSPTGDTALLVSWVEYPPMSQVAEPYLKLAGVRVEPRTRRKHDTPGGYGVAPCAQSMSIVDLATGLETPVSLPPDGCVDGFTWAADGKRFAFRNTSHDAVELWVGDTHGATHRLGDVRLNPMLGSSMQWMPDQQHLLVKMVPADAGAAPEASESADGPAHPGDHGRFGREQHLRGP